MPRVSVIMPAYNAAKTVSASVDCVLGQTFVDFELIIIDDRSTDNTAEILREYARRDDRVRIFQNEKNVGVSETRNLGITYATGDWIAFLDSDDLWLPEKLEKQITLAEKRPDAKLLFTASGFTDSDDGKYGFVMNVKECVDFKAVVRQNVISCSSVMVRKELMMEVKMPPDYMNEDHATWLALLQRIPFAYGVDEPLLVYRISKNSRSSNRVRAAIRLYRTYRYVNISPLAAMWLTFLYTFYSVKKRRKIHASKIG